MNLSYKTAKRLKDEGFPQMVQRNKYILSSGEVLDWQHSHSVYMPTLSELIEMCMDFYYPCQFNMGGMNTWWAIVRGEGNQKAIVPVQTGSTPEEAVAELWLTLKNESNASNTAA